MNPTLLPRQLTTVSHPRQGRTYALIYTNSRYGYTQRHAGARYLLCEVVLAPSDDETTTVATDAMDQRRTQPQYSGNMEPKVAWACLRPDRSFSSLPFTQPTIPPRVHCYKFDDPFPSTAPDHKSSLTCLRLAGAISFSAKTGRTNAALCTSGL